MNPSNEKHDAPLAQTTPASNGRRNSIFTFTALIAGAAAVYAGWRIYTDKSAQVSSSADKNLKNSANGAISASEKHPLLLLNATSVGGQPFDISPFLGSPLILNFWATWCPPCIAEIPTFDAKYHAFADKKFQLLGIAIDEQKAAEGFWRRKGLRYPTAIAGDSGNLFVSKISPIDAATGLPLTLLLDATGREVWRKVGQVADAEIDTLFQKAQELSAA